MRSVAFAGILLLAAPLAGCSVVTTTICADFVDYADPAAAAADASVVVVGTVAESTAQRLIYGVSSPVHTVTIEAVMKGDVTSGTEIEVAAAPLTCNGEAGAFPDGDPLDTDERVELFLFEEDGDYRLITPWDGVEAAPLGQPLPWTPEG